METEKKIGICMDHSHAHLIEYAEPMVTKVIASKFTDEEKERSLVKSEKMMHSKEQHDESEYYKEIGQNIRQYDDVLLFGPTEAKTELLNVLKKDHLFSKIKFEVRQTDKMTAGQEHAFVRDYFYKRKI